MIAFLGPTSQQGGATAHTSVCEKSVVCTVACTTSALRAIEHSQTGATEELCRDRLRSVFCRDMEISVMTHLSRNYVAIEIS